MLQPTCSSSAASGAARSVDDEGPSSSAARSSVPLLALLLLHANQSSPARRSSTDSGARSRRARPGLAAERGLQLRKLLGARPVLTKPPGYVLDVDPTSSIWAASSASSSARSAEAASGGRTAPRRARLWRGPPLADFAFEPFAQAEIARLEELRLAALEDRIDADLELGRHAELVPELEALVREHPLRERLRGQLMLALYRSGRQAEALEGVPRRAAALVDELGIEPGPALQALSAAILRQEGLEPSPCRRRQDATTSARWSARSLAAGWCRCSAAGERASNGGAIRPPAMSPPTSRGVRVPAGVTPELPRVAQYVAMTGRHRPAVRRAARGRSTATTSRGPCIASWPRCRRCSVSVGSAS